MGLTLVFLAVFYILFATAKFHDWDCSKHQGVLINAMVPEQPPQYAYREVVCTDGYRP